MTSGTTESMTEGNTELSSTKVATIVGENRPVINDEPDKVVYSVEDFPIILDGKIVGWGCINFVEKLGIWDWYNKSAVQNGIKSSYAISINLNMDEYLKDNSSLSLECLPYLIDSTEHVVGEPANIGWSGFSSVAELFDQNVSGNIEVNLQPHLNNIDNTLIKLDFRSADTNINFESVYISSDMLVTAKDGPSILTIDDVKQIESINGAIYTIKFYDIFRENHKTEDGPNISRGDYDYYDFCYQVKYENGPTNDREVLTFDSFDNFNIVVPLKIRVVSDTDSTPLNENVYTAERLLWSDSNDTDLYVFPFDKSLKVGKKMRIQCNRLIPNTTTTDADYIRIIIEFPEEQSARTSEELMSFNGRYVVWQVPFSNRKMEERPR